MNHRFALLGVLAAVLSIECSAAAQSYGVTNVGDLGYPVTVAQGINDSGEVVGTAAIKLADGQPLSRAFIWTKRGGMISLGTLGTDYGDFSEGYSVSPLGLVGGFSTVNDGRVAEGFVWSSTAGMTGFNYGEGTSVNDSGELVGFFASGYGRYYAWSSTLRLNISDYTETLALGVNDAGFIAGSGYGSRTGLEEALLWTPENEIFPLGTLPGGRHSRARAVSSNNIVVGESETTDGTTHAFLWTRTGGLQDLGILSGFATCVAEGVNSSGVVVGQCTPFTGTPHAFLWTSGSGMQDLNELVEINPFGTVTAANGINSSGQIAATSGTGNPTYALMLTPF